MPKAIMNTKIMLFECILALLLIMHVFCDKVVTSFNLHTVVTSCL